MIKFNLNFPAYETWEDDIIFSIHENGHKKYYLNNGSYYHCHIHYCLFKYSDNRDFIKLHYNGALYLWREEEDV